MRLPSISYLTTSASESLKRFALCLLCAFLVFITGAYQIITDFDSESKHRISNYILTFALGVPLFFSIRIWAETQKNRRKVNAVVSFIGVVLLFLIYFSLPEYSSTLNTKMPYIRYGLYSIIIHLLVSVAPVINHKMTTGFWQYNKQLFIRLWTSLLFAAVIYGGISLAFVVVGELFDLKVPNKFYGIFYVFANSVLNIWIFVSGVEKNIANLDKVTETPKGIKIFSQYILLPLLLIYLVIVYSYGFKILFTGDWPKGLVSFLIIGISLLGYLTNLLLHPYAKQEGQLWIKKFYNTFYILMLPLALLLFFAVGIRISDYGITINRYYLVLLGIWITFTSFYQLVKGGDIKMIPISLAIFVGLSSFGYWGADYVSETSQVNRLESIMKATGLLKDGKLVNEYDLLTTEPLTDVPFPQVADTTQKNIRSIIKYLDNYHRFDKIKGWFRQDITDLQSRLDSTDDSSWFDETEQIEAILGRKDWETITTSNYINFRTPRTQVYQTTGFDFMCNYEFNSYRSNSDFEVGDSTLTIYYDEINSGVLAMQFGDVIDTEIQVGDFINSLVQKHPKGDYQLPVEESSMYVETDAYKVKIEFRKLEVIEKNKVADVNSFTASVYLKLK